jgi:hypothetical protein
MRVTAAKQKITKEKERIFFRNLKKAFETKSKKAYCRN